MEKLIEALGIIEGLLWHNYVLYTILGVGILFTFWSGFGQYRALTHGVAVIRGKYDKKDDPGAISHFQALSAALSATVGLGNIGGVALAISLGGPGAVFWIWIVGFFGMSLKMTEVIQSMLYRNTDDPDNPHGGPMWVCERGFKEKFPGLERTGIFLGGLFVVTLLISAVTGGNMFQAWNVAEVTSQSFKEVLGVDVPKPLVGIILAVIVGVVIIGGIKRIGAVAGRLVPFMCTIYLIAALYVLALNIGEIPAMIGLIIKSAFSQTEAGGAFVGGTFGLAFLWGMKRALFSNEAGQGSAPIAHSAAKTSEPVREGIVAGLEPFIDTIVVCTLTALVILMSGLWNREDGEAFLGEATAIVETEYGSGQWTPSDGPLPERTDGEDWGIGQKVFVIVRSASLNSDAGTHLHRISGELVNVETEEGAPVDLSIKWVPYGWAATSDGTEPEPDPELVTGNIFVDYQGAALTSKAFDRATGSSMGAWMVTFASWLFAISTMISWSYYGEQGIVYLLGQKAVLLYKMIFCALIVVATTPILKSDAQVGTLTGFGTGVMLMANIPIMLIFGSKAMGSYHSYLAELKAGKFDLKSGPSVNDVLSGKDDK